MPARPLSGSGTLPPSSGTLLYSRLRNMILVYSLLQPIDCFIKNGLFDTFKIYIYYVTSVINYVYDISEFIQKIRHGDINSWRKGLYRITECILLPTHGFGRREKCGKHSPLSLIKWDTWCICGFIFQSCLILINDLGTLLFRFWNQIGQKPK